ncbi:hypothetical protein LOAG_01029 [Loa loa]|uniref:Uncharacterized protein n=1 Tax=Loa loa TaxID=7209 RepID=A0A1S0U9U8_LOALO|nr:hypothetical protein LOAG_01029 [Loa loa]EFO27458.1 hypothetical protein LOAG_01029 [Loa loa]
MCFIEVGTTNQRGRKNPVFVSVKENRRQPKLYWDSTGATDQVSKKAERSLNERVRQLSGTDQAARKEESFLRSYLGFYFKIPVHFIESPTLTLRIRPPSFIFW